MVVVTPKDAETQMEHLLELVEAGEEVVIAREGTPVAKLVPAEREAPRRTPRFGTAAGTAILKPGWDEPLTDEEIDELFFSEAGKLEID